MNNLSTVVGLTILLIGIAGSVIAILEWIRHGPRKREVIIVAITVVFIGGGVLISSSTTINVHHPTNPFVSNATESPIATPSPTPTPKVMPENLALQCTSCGLILNVKIIEIGIDTANQETYFLFSVTNEDTPDFQTMKFSVISLDDGKGNTTFANVPGNDWELAPGNHVVKRAIFSSFIPPSHSTYTLNVTIGDGLYYPSRGLNVYREVSIPFP